MEKTKMSVHRALAELKLLDSRIKNANSQAQFCIVNKVTNQKVQGLSLEEYNDKVIRASHNQVMDLINRRKSIKTEVVKSNANTEVEIGKVTMTVAEAIERKSSIEYEKLVLGNMMGQFNQANALATRQNEALIQQAENYVQTFFNDKEKADSEEVKKMSEDYINARKVEVLDPLGLRDKINELKKSIEDFELDVDSALSEINATTFVEV